MRKVDPKTKLEMAEGKAELRRFVAERRAKNIGHKKITKIPPCSEVFAEPPLYSPPGTVYVENKNEKDTRPRHPSDDKIILPAQVAAQIDAANTYFCPQTFKEVVKELEKYANGLTETELSTVDERALGRAEVCRAIVRILKQLDFLPLK